MRMASMRESRDSDRFLVNTQVQSHTLLRRGFGTSVPFIVCAMIRLGTPLMISQENRESSKTVNLNNTHIARHYIGQWGS